MTNASTEAPVLVARTEDDIVTLTLNRARFNLLDNELMALLDEEIAAASQARGLVLTGAHGCFCAGLDTEALGGYNEAERRRTVELLNQLVRNLYALPLPTVAAVPGHALAGGLIFALACDRRFVTSERCRLGLPEVQAGVPYPLVPLLVAQAELSPTTLRRLALTGQPLTPDAAVAEGVFDQAVAPDDLVETAVAEARALAEHPAYARIKAQLRGTVCAAADNAIATDADPMLTSWL